MKKALLLLFSILMVYPAFSQWAPDGAEWFYEYSRLSETGYIHIYTDGDTAILGQNCKILQKTRYTFDFFTSSADTVDLGREYTYYNNGIVYYYRFGKFFTLYDFNTLKDSSWTIAGNNLSINGCDSTSMLNVDSTGIFTIGTNNLKFFEVLYDSTDDWQLLGTTMERVGCLAYMFPEPFCISDISEGGTLRCYSDSLLGLFQTDVAIPCDTFIATGITKNQIHEIKIYPNPANEYISIKLPPMQQSSVIKIYDITGAVIIEKRIAANQLDHEIDISSAPNGIYTLILQRENSVLGISKFIKQK